MQVIDEAGYRANVGIIITNPEGQLFWAKRIGQQAWQFPQGGLNENESPEQTLFRELYEEIGLTQEKVKVLASTEEWLPYKLPSRLVRAHSKPVCIGQKQKWFLLAHSGDPEDFNLTAGPKAEFDGWKWVPYWYPLRYVVAFKREVYRQALIEFAPVVLGPPKGSGLDPLVGKE